MADIAPANVEQLQVAWQWRSVDDAVIAANPLARPGAYQDTPLMANGVLYTVTSLGQIAALDPGTGEARWVFGPGSWQTGRPGNLAAVRGHLALRWGPIGRHVDPLRRACAAPAVAVAQAIVAAAAS